MELLEQRILKDGKLLPGGILRIDNFLNHQMDPMLMQAMAKDPSLVPSMVLKMLAPTTKHTRPAMMAAMGSTFQSF